MDQDVPDDAIVEASLRTLSRARIADHRRLDVCVTNGIVVIRGEVTSERARSRACVLVETIHGVRRVVDLLSVVVSAAKT